VVWTVQHVLLTHCIFNFLPRATTIILFIRAFYMHPYLAHLSQHISVMLSPNSKQIPQRGQ